MNRDFKIGLFIICVKITSAVSFECLRSFDSNIVLQRRETRSSRFIKAFQTRHQIKNNHEKQDLYDWILPLEAATRRLSLRRITHNIINWNYATRTHPCILNYDNLVCNFSSNRRAVNVLYKFSLELIFIKTKKLWNVKRFLWIL